MTFRLLALAAHPESVAATRFRLTAYIPALQAAGIEVDFRPFIDDATLRTIHGKKLGASQVLGLAKGVAKRLQLLLAAKRYDAVLVQREAMLVGPPLVERMLARLGVPLIYDLDDAVWLHSEPIPGSFRARFPALGDFIRAPEKGNFLLNLASYVVCGSERLAAHARTVARDVTVIPTVTDLRIWGPKPGRALGAFTDSIPLIGWIGTPSTAPSLKLAEHALGRLHREGVKFRFRMRGAGTAYEPSQFPFESLPWLAASEPQDFAEFDIGIAPMRQDEWANGKCAFKQIQYMTCGVPHVSSRAGATDEMLVHNHNALIAESEDAWYTHLSALVTDHALRTRLAIAGRATIEQKYCLARQEPVMIDVVQRACAGSRAHSFAPPYATRPSAVTMKGHV